MTVEEMKKKKIELGMTGEMIAEASGVPLSTIQKIFSGITKAPRRLTLIAIEEVFRQEEESRRQSGGDGKHPAGLKTAALQDLTVRESMAFGSSTAQKKRYKIDDYYGLPDDQRVELIDGVFYDMGAPTLSHQAIVGDLYILFRECISQHGMPCMIFFSPCDVRLDKDDYTMVQPDLMVICREYDYSQAIRYEGAPDLVVEILSPSTRSRDQILKLYKYQNAGVREYWIVDPKFGIVTVHHFEEEEYRPKKYEFSDEIPVAISGGECVIDFSRIGKMLPPNQ